MRRVAMSSRTDKYARISSLADIAAEKKALKKRIAGQEEAIGRDWQKIRSAWSFIPKLRKGISIAANVLPTGIGLFSFIANLFSKNKL